MKYRTTLLAVVGIMTLIPGTIYAQNVTLSGNLNVNDNQMTSTSNLLLQVLASLAESIIPLIIGAVIGHKAIAFWLGKKERISTKNDAIANYSQAIKSHISLLDSFVERIFMSYLVFQKDEKSAQSPVVQYSNPQDNVTSFLKFPSEEDQMPSRRFSEEYKQLFSSISCFSSAGDRLVLDLKSIQKDDPKSFEKLEKIQGLIKRSEVLVAKFIQSKSSDELSSFRERFIALGRTIKAETDDFEKDLIGVKT